MSVFPHRIGILEQDCELCGKVWPWEPSDDCEVNAVKDWRSERDKLEERQ